MYAGHFHNKLGGWRVESIKDDGHEGENDTLFEMVGRTLIEEQIKSI